MIILTKTPNLIGGQVVHFCLTTYTTKTLAPEGGLNHSKVVIRNNEKTETEEARWHIWTPNSEDQQKLIRFYRKSGAKTKSDFVRSRLLGEAFKVITEDPSKNPYLEKLSEIIVMTNKIGIFYNDTVKVLTNYY